MDRSQAVNKRHIIYILCFIEVRFNLLKGHIEDIYNIKIKSIMLISLL